MGRRRQTEAEKRDARFQNAYRTGKARTGFCEEFVAMSLGISKPTLLARRHSPDSFRVDEFSKLGKLFEWTDEEMMAIIRP